MRSPFIILSQALGLALAGALAHAQPSATSGVGLGEKSRLHAKLDLSTMYDTNAFRLSDDDRVDENWRLLIRPGLWLEVPGSSFSFRLRGDATITQFLNDVPVTDQDSTQIGGNVGLEFKAGSDRSAVAFTIVDTLTRTPVFLSPPESVAADEVRFPEWRNEGQARVTVRPGGRALELDFGYRNSVSFFEELADSHQHLGLFDVRWKFLPKTALVLLSEFGLFVNEGNRVGNDATPLTVQVGLIGQLTSKFIAELRAGYGNSLVWANDDVFGSQSEASQDTVIGAAFLTYRPSDRSTITAGYERSVRPLIIFDSFIQDSIQLRASLGIDRLVGQVFGSYNLRNYGLNDRFAQTVLGGVSVDYYLVRYVSLGAQYRITYQDSDDDEQDQTALGDPTNPFVGDFTRHQVVFNVGVEY
ncbi:MAG: outer membrane beta-barrel protein [Myxococcales bacterium]|nr:outer membrane beta-barrel protein [Myxococcales bacterium]